MVLTQTLRPGQPPADFQRVFGLYLKDCNRCGALSREIADLKAVPQRTPASQRLLRQLENEACEVLWRMELVEAFYQRREPDPHLKPASD
jgi:hypothetical protein